MIILSNMNEIAQIVNGCKKVSEEQFEEAVGAMMSLEDTAKIQVVS